MLFRSIKEGSEVKVVESDLGPNDVALVVAGEPLTLSLEAARLIWVERRSSA